MSGRPDERRVAAMFVAPALTTIALIAIFPLAWTFWESLHRHDLRMPWLGRPFVGIANYVEIAGDDRFHSALGHTAFFTAVTVTLELLLGLFLALAMNRVFRGRGALRVAILLPWAIPTVVAGLLWRFLFQSRGGSIWFIDAWLAWVPVIVADVWKTVPFVALLLLAGLQSIPRELYEAASMDGAGPARQLVSITLPHLRPALLVALIFRTLDAFRVFDLIYVLTGGGPGTATEPIALLTFNALFQNLRSGYASALSVVVFLITFSMALLLIRILEVKESR
ncbi:MAG TPA: sugar ABC transporter permease [Thermoanaerobaculia bacterium]|nr:sugar ABC transporter permease [Thermoanaerobaculia bacterium]